MPEAIQTKICTKCKVKKPFTDFSQDKSKQDNVRSRCKQCCKADYKKYYQNESVKLAYQQRVKKYQQTDNGKAIRRKYTQSHVGKASKQRRDKKYNQSPKGKTVNRCRVKKYAQNNKEKIRAKNAVRIAIISGKLAPAFQFKCIFNPEHRAEHYHHHLGYTPEHWLDVIPLCRICHQNIHRL